MARYFPFNREDVFPSFFANRIQDFLAGARTDLRISKASSTKIAVIPDAALGVAAIAIDGRWRFNEATVERGHPGGGKGTYAIWAVALDNDVDDTPLPLSDHTVYTWELRITNGANPSGEGVEIFEKIGEVDWSGAEIEAIRQTHGSITGAMLADSALPATANSDVEWKRESGGGYLLQLKPESVDTAAIAAGAIAAGKVADSLKPSAGAAAATEALRALGTSGSTAAAGNDSRLSDERTPKNNSVTSAKIEDGAIAPGDLSTAAKRLHPQLVEALREKDRWASFSQEFVGEGTTEWSVNHGLPGIGNQQNLQVYYGVFNNNAAPSLADVVTVKEVTATKIVFRRNAGTKIILFWWKAETW